MVHLWWSHSNSYNYRLGAWKFLTPFIRGTLLKHYKCLLSDHRFEDGSTLTAHLINLDGRDLMGINSAYPNDTMANTISVRRPTKLDGCANIHHEARNEEKCAYQYASEEGRRAVLLLWSQECLNQLDWSFRILERTKREVATWSCHFRRG